MEEIAIKMTFPEKTAKFFGCHCSDTLILTNLKGCFGLTLGMTRLLVANLEITLSGIKFILLDDSGQQLLQFCNGVLSFHQDEDKIEYLKSLYQKFSLDYKCIFPTKYWS